MAKVARFNHVVPLPPEDGSLGFARMFKGFIDGKKKDKTRFFRKDLVVIRNLANNRTVVRLAVGAGSKVSIPADGLGLDYDARDELMIERDGVADLEVRSANLADKMAWLWNHPDRAERLMLRFGVVMGVFSLPDVVDIIQMVASVF